MNKKTILALAFAIGILTIPENCDCHRKSEKPCSAVASIEQILENTSQTMEKVSAEYQLRQYNLSYYIKKYA